MNAFRLHVQALPASPEAFPRKAINTLTGRPSLFCRVSEDELIASQLKQTEYSHLHF